MEAIVIIRMLGKITYWVYRIKLFDVFVIVAALVLIWAVLSVLFHSNGRKKPWKLIWAVSQFLGFLVACSAVVYVTLLHRSESPQEVVLVPFAFMEEAKRQPEVYRSVVMNILLFVPLGLTFPELLPQKWNNGIKICITCVLGLLVSLTIEFVQYYYGIGRAEVDDLLSNTLGTFIGATHIWIAVLISMLLEKSNHTSRGT